MTLTVEALKHMWILKRLYTKKYLDDALLCPNIPGHEIYVDLICGI